MRKVFSSIIFLLFYITNGEWGQLISATQSREDKIQGSGEVYNKT